MPDPSPDKARLRRLLRERRQALSGEQQAAAARSIAVRIAALSPWRRARRVALYLPADGEIDTAPLAAVARRDGKALFLPVIRDDDSLAFASWEENAPLAPNRFGIPEPPAGAVRCDPGELDVICLPLVGWDRAGGRLGMGGGFYDRTLAGIDGTVFIGLAHECQEVGALPLQDWDVRLDYVATGGALHDCRV
jgi:5-formyltetrahydrofolate cyclo-ligase